MVAKRKPSPIILERLKRYRATTDQQLINAAKEVLQEIALLGLSRSGFFKDAAFHGGTALRLFYGLDRFSEDLDFALQEPNKQFSLHTLTQPLITEVEAWGLDVEIVDRSKASAIVKKAFLKDSSLGAELALASPLARGRKFSVKIELDTNPPAGAIYESRLYEYPTDYYVTCHDEASMFAGKLHAILCRPYPKGRDWYDLAFYFSRKTVPNYFLLANALRQAGPWKDSGEPRALNLDWLTSQLRITIEAVNFSTLIKDVLPFVKDPRTVELWSAQFFKDKLERWGEQITKLRT